uniref:Secreted protein n=1 Tax=Acrobeloides nanus TaxID=290746 RepID=A0A914CJL3_9BILA
MNRKLGFLLIFLANFSIAERIFPCSNNAKPKLNNLGKPVQCLPGQDNELVCGRGYVCFFSGFNYQCCPSTASPEEQDSTDIDCPDGELTVLDSFGSPLTCDDEKTCPQNNMYCANIGRKRICCESLTPGSFQIKRGEEKIVQKGSKTHQQVENSDSKNVDLSESECPAPSLTVLGDDGQPLICSKSQDCPQDNMECYKFGKSGICCENLATANNPKNPLKYRPQASQKVNDEHEIQKEVAPTVVTSRPRVSSAKTSKPKTVNEQQIEQDYDYGEISTQEPASAIDETNAVKPPKKPKNRSRNLALAAQLAQPNTKTNEESIMEFKPHNSGGYAVKKIKNNRKRPPESRLLAQQYLLEQIKNGWPYDEKFYRTAHDTR